MKRNVLMVHAALAAVRPLSEYYAAAAPDLEVTSLLDDGLIRYFAQKNDEAVYERLADLITMGVRAYRAETSIVTCSAASPAVIARLEREMPIPVIKIDAPLARNAVRAGSRVGAIISFGPTVPVTLALIDGMARAASKPVTVEHRVIPEALAALNAGDRATHDALLTAAARELAQAGCDALLLAQVSMAHLRAPLAEATGLPVFESLSSSLEAVRESLAR